MNAIAHITMFFYQIQDLSISAAWDKVEPRTITLRLGDFTAFCTNAQAKAVIKVLQDQVHDEI